MTIKINDKHRRVTDWFSVLGFPAWADSDVAAYMIEEEMDHQGYVSQRHAWKLRDGTVNTENWILTSRRALSIQ